jgi:hypothetical protein
MDSEDMKDVLVYPQLHRSAARTIRSGRIKFAAVVALTNGRDDPTSLLLDQLLCHRMIIDLWRMIINKVGMAGRDCDVEDGGSRFEKSERNKNNISPPPSLRNSFEWLGGG